MAELALACERCGGAALVHMTHEIGQGPGVRHLCLDCAEWLDDPVPARDQSVSRGAILVAVGAFTLILSLFADQLDLGREEGFGWKQYLAVTLGVVLVTAAAIVRVGTLLIIGGLFVIVVALADWLGLGSQAGFGLRQASGCLLGLALTLGGAVRARRRLNRASPAHPS